MERLETFVNSNVFDTFFDVIITDLTPVELYCSQCFVFC